MKNDFNSFDSNQDRFKMPRDIYRVTSGKGGECFLIYGESETAIYDCGMAYCHEGTVENIENKLKELGKEGLDYVILSHTHYDHMGALPYIIEKWPGVKVCGAEKVKYVFESEKAKETMKRLGEAARDKYLPEEKHGMEISVEGLRIDRILKDGEILHMGNKSIKAIYTPGHTDCSVSYLIEEAGFPSIMFMSESVGVLESDNKIHTSILKSFDDTILSAEKCRKENADILISSHFGVVPEEIKEKYFDMYTKFAETERDFILDCFDKGMNYDELYQSYEDHYWTNARIGAQPREAFTENAGYTIRCIVKNFRNQAI